MKAIILVAGAGTKLRPHTYVQPKALMPIAGKPIISFIVNQLYNGGIREFIFVVGHLGEKIQEYITHTYPHLQCHFVYQTERKGTGHGILMAKDILNNEEVFIALGDTICDFDIQEVIQTPFSMLGVKKVDDPRNFGVAELTENGFIGHVIEKPAIPKSNMALVGLYKIKETQILFECLQYIIDVNMHRNGDFNLTDALDCMLKKGIGFKSFRVKHWYDCGRKETLLESNAILLKKYGGNIHETVINENAIIIHPVSIGANARLVNAIVGPHVSIGANSVINKSIVRDSIIGSYANLYEVVLDNSLIGSDASATGLSRSLNISDNTEIDFG
ncbi:MAG: NTP transferase domain-containing protein [Chitinophagaceae bacterium]|nr:NTP transferase domain-containing protein [Chitinophagaceae bacterium]